MFRLDGKKALVTGATGGLGEGIVERLISQGARVVATGTRRDALQNLAEPYGDACLPLTCNLKDPEAVNQLISQAENLLGGLDILVNNAGLTRDNLALRMKDDEFTDVLSVNLEAPFRLMRSALKGMMKQRYGRIINISSVVGVTGNPGQANYCASKAGLIGMSKSMALEIATRGITINCIAPGFMSSNMTESLTDDQKKTILASIPMKTMGSAQDIAAAVVYLSSTEAGYMTGQTLHINGGMAMI